MNPRTERIGKNEALFRDVNERVRDVDASFGGDGERLVSFYCECGEATCAEQIELTLPEYEHVRAAPTHFAIVPGHDIPDVEDVVESFESRAAVVRKHEGDPARLARAENPR